MMKKNIILIIAVIIGFNALGQEVISVQTDFGLASKIAYKADDFDQKNKFGFNLGVNYTYFIKPTFAIESGIGIAAYAAEIKLPSSYQYTNYEVDTQGSGFEFRATSAGYKEEHKLTMLSIPVKARFEGQLIPSKNILYYAAAGFKFLIPISQKADISAKSITTKGYYPNDNLLIEDIPKHGFSTYNDINSSSDKLYKGSIAFTAELGVGITVNSYTFFAGGFVDYGLTDLRKKTSSYHPFIDYTGSNSVNVNGISKHKNVDNAHIFSTGIQFLFPIYNFK